MSDRWTQSLSAYLDEELELEQRVELEAHLRECGECAATLVGLRRVVERAWALPRESAAPIPDLWPGIESRLEPPSRAVPIRRIGTWAERRVSFSVPQLAAACLAAAIISGGAVWYARTSGQREAGELIPGPSSGGGGGIVASAPPSASGGSSPGTASTAVEELRRALANGRDDLDPATVRTLEESLTIIDIAIQQAGRALEADPKNPYVRAHLDETMRRKVELLHRATMLASAPR
jgi:hypothetical protein